MKRVPKPVFFIVALLILAFTFTAVFGIAYYNGDNKVTVFKGINDIRWGIDIRGGVEATFKPADGYDATDEQLDSAKSIIPKTLSIERSVNPSSCVITSRSNKILSFFFIDTIFVC